MEAKDFLAAVPALNEMKSTPSLSNHVCKLCGAEVPQKQLNVLGEIKYVQPVCPCEAKAAEDEYYRPERERRRKEIERRFDISNLGDRFEECVFESFFRRSGTDTAYKMSKRFAEEFPSWGQDALLIHGPVGNGKTHLAAAVAHAIRAKGYIVVFVSVPELLARIRRTFNKGSKENESDLMYALVACDLLILDDLGAEKITDWTLDVLFRIVDERYRRKRPIFYTANPLPSEIKVNVGDRIYDRIQEMVLIVENKGGSYRHERAQERFNKIKFGELPHGRGKAGEVRE